MLRPIYPGSIHTPLEEALIYLGLTRQFKYANMWNTKYAYQICLEMCLWMQDKPLLHWQYFSLPFFRYLIQLQTGAYVRGLGLWTPVWLPPHSYTWGRAGPSAARVVWQRGNRKRTCVSSLKIQVRRPHLKFALNYTISFISLTDFAWASFFAFFGCFFDFIKI